MTNLDAPFYFDMATCAGAAGKLEVAEARGEHVPEGWLIDKNGNPTTDPATVKDGGAIRPMGGNEGYKGYALAASSNSSSYLSDQLGRQLGNPATGGDPPSRSNHPRGVRGGRRRTDHRRAPRSRGLWCEIHKCCLERTSSKPSFTHV